jgi:hypothetical protein
MVSTRRSAAFASSAAPSAVVDGVLTNEDSSAAVEGVVAASALSAAPSAVVDGGSTDAYAVVDGAAKRDREFTQQTLPLDDGEYSSDKRSDDLGRRAIGRRSGNKEIGLRTKVAIHLISGQV